MFFLPKGWLKSGIVHRRDYLTWLRGEVITPTAIEYPEDAAIVDLPPEDHEHMHVVHHDDGTTTTQHYGDAKLVPGSAQTVFILSEGVTDYVISRKKL